MEGKSNNKIENKEKKYLYHVVPNDLRGNIIYPLNELKDIHPDLYISKAAKYKGREEEMDNIIKGLECKWNDVIFLSPVSPEDLKKELIKAGLGAKEYKFYQIDPEKLDPKNTKVFLFNKLDHSVADNEFVDFKLKDLEKYSVISEKTKKHFNDKEFKQKNGYTLLFAFIPHILHKGPIDISDLPVITV